MKAFLKRFALPMLALVMALCVGLAACDNEVKDPANGGDTTQDPQNITYTITAECEDNILGGVKVQIKDGTAVVAESNLKNGVATFSLPAATYTVDIAEKAGFEGFLAEFRWSTVTVTSEAPNATITIISAEKETGNNNDDENKVTYTLTVLLPNGTPVSGIDVQLCGGLTAYSCHLKTTDANGVAVFKLEPAEYEVHIDSCPTSYTFDNTEHKTNATGGNITIYLKAA